LPKKIEERRREEKEAEASMVSIHSSRVPTQHPCLSEQKEKKRKRKRRHLDFRLTHGLTRPNYSPTVMAPF